MANTNEVEVSAENINIAEMSDEDVVIQFLLDNKVQKPAIDEVIKRGFTSLEALKLIEGDDLNSARIAVGQRKLILHVTQTLKSSISSKANEAIPDKDASRTVLPSTSSSSVEPRIDETNNGDLYARTLANTLFSQQQQMSQIEVPQQLLTAVPHLPTTNSQPVWSDPQVHIASASGKSVSSFHDICDFVPQAVEEEVLIGGQGEHQVVIKSGSKKPKLESLSLSQWAIANMAILYRLVNENKLLGQSLMDYLSYTTKVFQLVQRFSLVSVLLYDREYRKLQAEMGFRWGTDVQHLHTLFLQPRERNATNPLQSRRGPVQHTKQFKPEKREIGICRNFNAKKGCSFSGCKYKHLCIIPGCNQQHSANVHTFEKN